MKPTQFNYSDEKIVRKHIELFNKNQVPKNSRGKLK